MQKSLNICTCEALRRNPIVCAYARRSKHAGYVLRSSIIDLPVLAVREDILLIADDSSDIHFLMFALYTPYLNKLVRLSSYFTEAPSLCASLLNTEDIFL